MTDVRGVFVSQETIYKAVQTVGDDVRDIKSDLKYLKEDGEENAKQIGGHSERIRKLEIQVFAQWGMYGILIAFIAARINLT